MIDSVFVMLEVVMNRRRRVLEHDGCLLDDQVGLVHDDRWSMHDDRVSVDDDVGSVHDNVGSVDHFDALVEYFVGRLNDLCALMGTVTAIGDGWVDGCLAVAVASFLTD